MPAWLLILLTCCLLLLPSWATTHVSSEDALLLAAEPEPLRCFSRQFEDLTCFWDEVEEEEEEEEEEAWAEEEEEGGQQDPGPYQLFFAYPGSCPARREEPQVCPLSIQKLPTRGLRHVCQIQPADGVRLFAKLTLWVWDPARDRNRTQRVLSLENVGLPAPPRSITAVTSGQTGELQVTWEVSPSEISDFMQHELQYGPSEPSKSVQATVTALLQAPMCCPFMKWPHSQPHQATATPRSDLTAAQLLGNQSTQQYPTIKGPSRKGYMNQGPAIKRHTVPPWDGPGPPGATRESLLIGGSCIISGFQPGTSYWLQLRSKPDGISLKGFWGPWSSPVTVTLPRDAREIGLQCFTKDLENIRCQWQVPDHPTTSQGYFYHWKAGSCPRASKQAGATASLSAGREGNVQSQKGAKGTAVAPLAPGGGGKRTERGPGSRAGPALRGGKGRLRAVYAGAASTRPGSACTCGHWACAAPSVSAWGRALVRRGPAWEPCEKMEPGPGASATLCGFQAQNDSAVHVLVEAGGARGGARQYLGGPFWTRQIGEPRPAPGSEHQLSAPPRPCPAPALSTNSSAPALPLPRPSPERPCPAPAPPQPRPSPERPCPAPPHPTPAPPRALSAPSSAPPVLTEAPELRWVAGPSGQLKLTWSPPPPGLPGRTHYQLRYKGQKAGRWQVLEPPRGALGETLELRPGAQYRLQLRARPDGPTYHGPWSAWSAPALVELAPESGWVSAVTSAVLTLSFGGLLGLVLRRLFPARFRALWQTLWPPLPDLHRVLGGFLTEPPASMNQPKASGSGVDEEEEPSLLEILSASVDGQSQLDYPVLLQADHLGPWSPPLAPTPSDSELDPTTHIDNYSYLPHLSQPPPLSSHGHQPLDKVPFPRIPGHECLPVTPFTPLLSQVSSSSAY
ncbi:thrombopoietin receptor [Macrotis lagotis]|uniref:thrombopoietin receptor n=1 Tax=Macrotis lagotis TaxID=92651 RepID=UPI003D68CDAA